MKRRPLSEEELRLWQQVMRHTQPLRGGQESFDEEEPVTVPTPDHRIFPKPPAVKGLGELQLGVYDNIDRSTAERFRKGDYPIDGELDLHGMSAEKAHRALMAFVQAQYGRGSRCLLVITGKGNVLRQLLPSWLDAASLRPMVLVVDVAKGKHGGSGAYYLLLRRKR